MEPKGKKRVLAVLLAVCMVLFAVPFTTYAAEDTHMVKIIIANSSGNGIHNLCIVTLTEQSSGQEIVCNRQMWFGEYQYFVQVPNGTYDVSCTIDEIGLVQGSVDPIVVAGADVEKRYREYYTNFYDTLDTSYYGAKHTFSVLEKPQDPVKEGYIFKQWVTAKENGEPFDFNTALTKNMSLYADWEHDHSYGAEWKSDADNHWHECSCGEKKDNAAHIEGIGVITKAPTETEAGTKTYSCSVCGYVMRTESIPVLEHNYGDDWEKDTENHWHKCSNCGDKKDLAAHTWDQGEVTKEATCTEAGEKKYTCTVCDAVKKEVIPVLGHSYGSDWEKDTENHWHECGLCGDKKDLAVHTWDQGEVTKEAACTEAGEKKYTCTVCGVVKIEVIPVLAHSYGTDWKHDVENHWHECVFCGGKNESAAHIEGDGIVTKEPTAAGTGIKTYSCSVCGYEMRTESIPATGTGEIGTLQTEIERGNNVPSVQIPMSDSELADAVLTAEEKGSIRNGADVKILLTVENAAGSVSGEDKTVVEAVLGELTTGQYFDINLLKIINGVESKILETTGTIKITIAIPDSLKNSNRAKNREFVIIRVHDGKATILNDLDTDADTITIETDRFSTYALAYRDSVANNVNKNNGTGSKSDIPQTGDSTPLVHYAMVSMLAAGALMILLACRKRKGIQE